MLRSHAHTQRAAVEAGAPIRGLLAANQITAGAAGIEAM